MKSKIFRKNNAFDMLRKFSILSVILMIFGIGIYGTTMSVLASPLKGKSPKTSLKPTTTTGTHVTTVNKAPRFEGASATTLARLDKLLETARNTTTGTGVINYTQISSRGRNADFQWLIVGGKAVVSTERITIYQLSDGTKVIKRPSTTGPKTIEIQRSNGKKVMEIRYDND